ncbi:MAG: hypothetical protein EOM05_09295 [Clostridia bacterium]|nr:hypothetical protein [Clostridia bacterium]
MLFQKRFSTMARNVTTEADALELIEKEIKAREKKRLWEFYHPDRDGALWDFLCYFDSTTFNKDTESARKVIADAVQDVITGKTEKLMINCPPRTGKSYIVSIACAYALAYYRDESIMRNTGSATLAEEFSGQIREWIEDERFQNVFTDLHLNKKKKAREGWSIGKNMRSNYRGTGVDGTITGFGYSMIGILDDTIRKPSECTVTNLESQWRFFISVQRTRRENNIRFGGRKASEVIIATRWDPEDISGRLLDSPEAKKWKIINMKALVPNIYDPNAKSFCEAIYTTEELKDSLQTQKKTGTLGLFMALFQQEPMSQSGQLFQKDIMSFYKKSDLHDEKPIAKYMVIDYANKGSDFFSAPIIYQYSDGYYMVDCVFTQDDINKTHPQIIAKILEHRPNILQCETNAGGQLYVENLKRDIASLGIVMPEIREKYQTTNKETRILASAGQIMQNIKFLVDTDQHEQYNAFMMNLFAYAKDIRNAHDDAPDSLEQFISMINFGGFSATTIGGKRK